MCSEMKVAMLIYPDFSNYEISVAASIFMQAGKVIETFSVTKEIIRSEEGLGFMADKLLLDVIVSEYDCLLLPGCWQIDKIIDDQRYTDFLKKFKDVSNMVIASISSSPLLLAKAGIIGSKKYRIGLTDEGIAHFDFLIKENILKDSIVIDDNLITAVGGAFVEFGVAVGKKLNLNFNPRWYGNY